MRRSANIFFLFFLKQILLSHLPRLVMAGVARVIVMMARMELGDSIPEELYRTIAEIIAFAWTLKGKFPVGYDPDAGPVERDVTERGDDY